MSKSITYKSSGPILDGKGPKAVEAFLDEATEDVAKEAFDEVRRTLGSVLQHPTGRYESRIQTERASTGYVVNDGGVIYGPWLEGTGSRNNRTKFKGYSTFRKTAQRMKARAADIADKRAGDLVRRLGG